MIHTQHTAREKKLEGVIPVPGSPRFSQSDEVSLFVVFFSRFLLLSPMEDAPTGSGHPYALGSVLNRGWRRSIPRGTASKVVLAGVLARGFHILRFRGVTGTFSLLSALLVSHFPGKKRLSLPWRFPPLAYDGGPWNVDEARRNLRYGRRRTEVDIQTRPVPERTHLHTHLVPGMYVTPDTRYNLIQTRCNMNQ